MPQFEKPEAHTAIFRRRKGYAVDSSSPYDGQRMHVYGELPDAEHITEAVFMDGSEINVFGDEIELIKDTEEGTGNAEDRN